MLIHLNTSDEDFVSRVCQRIQDQSPDTTIHTDPQAVHTYVPGSGEHVLTSGVLLSVEDAVDYRYLHLGMASLGGRLWVQTERDKTSSPWVAEALDKVVDVRQVLTDAAFAEGRAAHYRSFGVKYLGRVFSDPRTIVVLDNKKGPVLHPETDPHVASILASLPESKTEERSWASVALVSAGNVTKLEEFLDYLSETNVVACSTGAFAKLNFMGRDYGQLPTPTADPLYGTQLLDVASRLVPRLAL